jgi:hypothetical protein
MKVGKLILLFALTSLVIWGIGYIKPEFIHIKVWYIQGFFFFIYFISARINNIALSKPTSDFHIFYFTAMTIRFFLAIIFLFFWILKLDSQKFTFIINFIVLYLFYVGFEIYFLIHNLRADFKKDNAKN